MREKFSCKEKNSRWSFYFNDINKDKVKKATPKAKVNLLKNSSKPLSFRLTNNSEFPP